MRLSEARHAGEVPGLGPDSKSQVTLRYENGKPVEATSVVVSTQHHESLDQAQVRELVRPYVEEVLPTDGCARRMSFYVNPPAGSSSADPTATAGSPDARSSSTPTAARPPTAEARSPARTPPRGPLGRLRRPLPREERRRRRPGRALHDPGRLRHRGVEAAVRLRRHRRDGARATNRSCRTCCGSSWTCRRAASARTSASAGRSTAVPPPTATSAASRTPTEASPGSGPIWFPT